MQKKNQLWNIFIVRGTSKYKTLLFNLRLLCYFYNDFNASWNEQKMCQITFLMAYVAHV